MGMTPLADRVIRKNIFVSACRAGKIVGSTRWAESPCAPRACVTPANGVLARFTRRCQDWSEEQQPCYVGSEGLCEVVHGIRAKAWGGDENGAESICLF